jgi:hypothetical protein
MASQRIRIIPKRREVDVGRLAEALLVLIDHLSPEDRARFLAEGRRALGEEEGGDRPKGSAA